MNPYECFSNPHPRHPLLLSDLVFFSFFRSFGFATTNSNRLFNPHRDSMSFQHFRFAAPIAMWPSNYLQLASLCRTRRARAMRVKTFWSWIEKQWCHFKRFHEHLVAAWRTGLLFGFSAKRMLPVFFICHLRQVLYNVHGVGALVTPTDAIR